MIQRINLEAFFSRWNNLLRSWSTLKSFCTRGSTACPYEQQLTKIRQQIEETMRNAEKVKELLQGHETTQKPRIKRAWFSAIGKISRTIFGTLDEEAGEEIKQLIGITANDTRQLAKLLANQTELIHTEFGILHEKADELEAAMEEVTNRQASLQIQEEIAEALNLLEDNVLQYELDTEILTDAVLFATQGIVHPRFVTPEQIEKSEALAKETVTESRFPSMGADMSITELIKISDVSILFQDTHLVYYIGMPLLDYNDYDLHKASALPIKQKSLNASDTFAYIWPETEYFALDRGSSAYIPITLDALNKCKKLNNLYICKNTEPVHEINDGASCELKISTGKIPINLSECKIKIIKSRDTFWMRTSTPNTWIFSTSKKERLFSSCKRLTDNTIDIDGVGTLRLPHGCTARTNTVRLAASREVRVNYSTILFNETELDVVSLLNNTGNTPLAFIKDTLAKEDTVKSLNLKKDMLARSLKTGRDFRDIIDKAKRLGEYKDIYGRFSSLQSTVTYSGTGVLTFVIIAVIIWKVLTRRGAPLLNRDRLISDHKNTHAQPSAEHLQMYETRRPEMASQALPYYLPLPPTGLSLPNLQQLAAANGMLLQPALMPRDSRVNLHMIGAKNDQDNQSRQNIRLSESTF